MKEKFSVGIRGKFVIVNEEQCTKVQERLFEYGYTWLDGSTNVHYSSNIKAIHLEKRREFGFSITSNYKNYKDEVELDTASFIGEFGLSERSKSIEF